MLRPDRSFKLLEARRISSRGRPAASTPAPTAKDRTLFKIRQDSPSDNLLYVVLEDGEVSVELQLGFPRDPFERM